jgi:hypothetical protein
MNMLNTPYYPEITIAGFSFTSTVVRSENVTWSRATGKVKALARDAYVFHLCIQQLQYVHTFLLSKICHCTEFSEPEGTRATTFTDNIRVYMEWCDHQFAPTNLTTPGGGRRYGFDRCHSQTPCPLF